MIMDSNSLKQRSKAVIYVRVSTGDQVQGASLDTQEHSCRQFAEHTLNAEIIKIFREEGESAKTANRTRLTEMLTYLHQHKGMIDYVVFYDMSRASRNASSYLAVIKTQLQKLGVKVRSVNEPGIDDSPMGRFMETFSVAYAQMENEIKGVKVNASMGERAARGFWITQPPLGFVIKIVQPDGSLADSNGRKERVKLPKVLVPDETTFPGCSESVSNAIRITFNHFATGSLTKGDAYRMAISLGLRKRNGEIVPYNSFEHMLSHPVYAGYSKPGRLLTESIKLNFDGLIDKETFDRIQVILNGEHKEFQPRSQDLYPLDGTIRCNKCGMLLHGDAPKDGSNRYHARYYCRGGTKRGHSYESTKADEIHALFDAFLQQIVPTDGMKRLFKEILKRTAFIKLGNTNAELEKLRQKESELATLKTNVLKKFVDDKISEEEKTHLINDLETQCVELRIQRDELENQQNLNESTIEYVCNFMDMPAKLWRDADLTSKRALQQILFPSGLHIDLKSKKCRTEDLSPLYSVTATKKAPEGDNSDYMVTSAGVEPALTG